MNKIAEATAPAVFTRLCERQIMDRFGENFF